MEVSWDDLSIIIELIKPNDAIRSANHVNSVQTEWNERAILWRKEVALNHAEIDLLHSAF